VSSVGSQATPPVLRRCATRALLEQDLHVERLCGAVASWPRGLTLCWVSMFVVSCPCMWIYIDDSRLIMQCSCRIKNYTAVHYNEMQVAVITTVHQGPSTSASPMVAHSQTQVAGHLNSYHCTPSLWVYVILTASGCVCS
jgi:hypothetical protein